MFIKATKDESNYLIPLVHIRAYDTTNNRVLTADGSFSVAPDDMQEWLRLIKQDVFDPKAIKIAPIGIVKGG